MYELGYFESLKNHKNVILILDESVSVYVPSMLRGHYITRYDIYDNGIGVICDRIEGILNL